MPLFHGPAVARNASYPTLPRTSSQTRELFQDLKNKLLTSEMDFAIFNDFPSGWQLEGGHKPVAG